MNRGTVLLAIPAGVFRKAPIKVLANTGGAGDDQMPVQWPLGRITSGGDAVAICGDEGDGLGDWGVGDPIHVDLSFGWISRRTHSTSNSATSLTGCTSPATRDWIKAPS